MLRIVERQNADLEDMDATRTTQISRLDLPGNEVFENEKNGFSTL
jgi:hypothetical protein